MNGITKIIDWLIWKMVVHGTSVNDEQFICLLPQQKLMHRQREFIYLVSCSKQILPQTKKMWTTILNFLQDICILLTNILALFRV